MVAATTVEISLAAAGLIVTILAVLLSAVLSARAVAKACMRREHQQIADRVDRLESWRDSVGVRIADLEREIHGH